MSGPLQFNGLERVVLPPGPVHVAVGMFDGVHLGHRAVIEAAVQSARRIGGRSVVLTFDPHPSVLFRPEDPVRLILSTEEKVRLIGALGVDAVVVQPFTREFASVEADDFLPFLRRRLPGLAAVYVGENWRYGRGRLGDVAGLLEAGRREGVTVFSAPRVSLDGAVISSTRIRGAIAAGRIDEAGALLGYVYPTVGTVVTGRRLGRTIDFPTLNIDWNPDLRPRFGVYVVRVEAASGDLAANLRPGDPRAYHPGVANYGVRPTVENTPVARLEIHILGPCPYTYGDRLRVEWLRFLRPEEKFESLPALVAQIGRDAAAARAEFSLP